MLLACLDGPVLFALMALPLFMIAGFVALAIDLSRAWRRHGRAAQRGFEVIVHPDDEQIS